jgi:hypothetical protein
MNLGIAQSQLSGGGGGGGSSSGFTFRGVWSNVTVYAVNDVATRKGSVYVAVAGNSGSDPYLDTTSTNWNLFTQGFNFVSTWLVGTSYNYFDVVTLNNSFYVSIVAGEQTNTGNNPQIDAVSSPPSSHWALLDQGFKFQGTYAGGTTYQPYDVVAYNSSSYIGLTLNNIGNTPSTSPTNWALLAQAGLVAVRQTEVFTMPSAPITNVSLTSNVVTLNCVNSFTSQGEGTGPGQSNTLYVSGLGTATFLNGQVLTIVTISGTVITANFTHADYISAADSGTLTLSISINGRFNTTIPLGKTFAASKVVCAQASRIELYSTIAARTADAGRAATTQPTAGTQHGVILDLNLDGVQASFTSWVCSPLAYGANLEDGTVNIPSSLSNIAGTPTTNTFSITLTFTFEEQ